LACSIVAQEKVTCCILETYKSVVNQRFYMINPQKFLVFYFIIFGVTVFSQVINSVSVACLNESNSLKVFRFSPVHFGYEVGVMVKESASISSPRSLTVTLGGYNHKEIETALYCKGEFVFTIKKVHGLLGVDLASGLGYLHSFYLDKMYSYEYETGELVDNKNYGRSQLIFSGGVGIRYLKLENAQPFMKQEFILEGSMKVHSWIKAGVFITVNRVVPIQYSEEDLAEQ
jgi:hypothetical protein